MEFAFLDESGDLGAKGSKKLVLCLICTRQSKKLSKIISKTKQSLLNKSRTTKWLNKMGGEIKFYSFPDEDILIRALKKISNLDIDISYICFNKNNKKLDKKSKEDILIYLFKHILEKSDNEIPEKIVSDRNFLGEKVTDASYFLLKDLNYTKMREFCRKNNKIEELRKHIKFDIISPDTYRIEKEKKSILKSQEN